MLKTVSSVKHHKDISYYTENIMQSDWSDIHSCTGYADDSSGAYEITFDERGGHHYVKDIEKVE